MTDSPASPRLVALRAALAAGEGAAPVRFWAEGEQRDAPLIGPLPGDVAHALVTFLWRDGAPGAGVYPLGGLVAGRGRRDVDR